MKDGILCTAMVFWVGTAIDSNLGIFAILLWLCALAATWKTTSRSFALFCLVASVSYHFMDIHTGNTLQTWLLPITFCLSFPVAIAGFLVKYFTFLEVALASDSRLFTLLDPIDY